MIWLFVLCILVGALLLVTLAFPSSSNHSLTFQQTQYSSSLGSSKRTLYGVAAICFGLMIVVCLYLIIKDTWAQKVDPKPDVHAALKNSYPNVEVQYMHFQDAEWNSRGPIFEPAANGFPARLWMERTGFISYAAMLSDVRENSPGSITTRLSAFRGRITVRPIFSSYVNMVVNGTDIGVFNVIPENRTGAGYRWSVPQGVLKNGLNMITLEVKDSMYANGLAIYQPIAITYYTSPPTDKSKQE